MACSSFSFCSSRNPYFSRLKVQSFRAQVRSQSLRDEGNSGNAVDANMSVLRHRMEQVRMRERLDTCHNLQGGWDYRSRYDDVQKKHNLVVTSIELASIVGSTIGLVFFLGSICIFLFAFIFHH